MAGNTITNILPKILAQGLLALRESAIMPRLVTTEYGDEAAQKGSTIDVPLPKAQTVSDVTAAPTYSSAQGNTPGLVQIPLDQHKHTDFFLTDKEMVEVDRNRHFVPMQSSEAIKGLANTMDTHIMNQYKGIYGYVGTAGTIPFSTVATATDTRKTLHDQLAPVNDRRVVLNPTAEAQALQLSAFSDVEKSADRPVKIEGELGRKFGMDFFMDQNVVTHTAGTAASTTAAGVSTVGLTASSAGTLLVGDIFTIAGDDQTYVVAASVNVSANIGVRIDPPLKAIATAADAVTKKATHVVNLAFTPRAFAFATRPLMENTMDVSGGNQMISATDPITGLSLRVEVIRQYKQTAWDYDVLYGAKLVRPELAVRIAG
jgi:hypothetical protein